MSVELSSTLPSGYGEGESLGYFGKSQKVNVVYILIYNPKSTSMFFQVITAKRTEQLPGDPGRSDSSIKRVL